MYLNALTSFTSTMHNKHRFGIAALLVYLDAAIAVDVISDFSRDM